MWYWHTKCTAVWVVCAWIQTQSNTFKLGEEHFWGTKQFGMSGNENHDWSKGVAEMRTMCCFSYGFGLLWSGKVFWLLIFLDLLSNVSTICSLVRQKSHLERMLLNPAAIKEKSIDVQTDLEREDHENSVKKSSNNPPKFTRVFEMVNKWWHFSWNLINKFINLLF